MSESRAELRERAYIEGARAAWRRQLQAALGELRSYGAEVDTEQRLAAAVLELDDTRAGLRELCRDHGDNDWPDNLYLRDVVEKHLAPHLDERGRECD